MSERCSACNALIDEGMKICPNCGRLISSIGDKHEYQPRKRQQVRPAGAAVKKSSRPPAKQQARPQPQRAKAAPKAAAAHKPKKKPAPQRQAEQADELPRWSLIVRRLVVILVAAAVIYFGLFGLQVFRIRHSSYRFDTEMKLSSSNYGEAFDSSVQEGGWSYNPFTFGMTYRGRHDGKDIAVHFSAGISVTVKSITVGEEEKTTDEQIHNYLMGLFI